ncbi:MAG TPA: Gfo/Idh/MocA family oxidoreductase [Gemmataceae bacterium]|jgi:predicted dehydrogenase|nr:Gfo/Idh/MocA family oxidoreductase [Gemmataceae bacterium]
MSQTRRDFLKSSLVYGSAITIAGTKSSGRVLGANDVIRVGVAGIHGQGNAHIGEYLKLPGVQITYLIDPDKSLWESRSKPITEKYGVAPKCVTDIRQALEDKELDAISIATPNHWHSLMTIWACQAGKDVYVEKPMSHNVMEGRRVMEAALKYKRIVQHGTQQRSSTGRASEIAAVQSGKYGKLLVSKGYCCKPRWSIGRKDKATPPADLDFHIWLGPAAEQPYHGNLVHYNWHWFWDFGNGDIGNQGIHEVDVARWAIKDALLPTKVWSLGGRFADNDQGQTPNMQMAVMEYGDVLLVFEVRGLVENKTEFKLKVGNEYFTSEGRIERGMFYPRGDKKPEKLAPFDVKVTPGGSWGSFLNVVRSRKVEECNAGPEKGHNSAALCHLANISYRLGEQVPFDGKAKLGDNREVVETFKNLQDNLTGVGVKLDKLTYQLGRTLTVDPAMERFTGEGSKEANAFLTREYRKPFVVPEKV